MFVRDSNVAGPHVLHFYRSTMAVLKYAAASEEPVLGEETTRTALRGHGLWLHGPDGDYLDGVSGTFNLPLGYDHAAVVHAVNTQLSRVAHVSSHLAPDAAAPLKQQLLAFAPSPLREKGAVWLRDVIGSTAVEGAIKIAQKATGKGDVISLFLSHHGQTIYTTAIAGNAFRRENQPDAVSAHSLKVPGPYCHRCFYDASYPGCGLRCATKLQDFIEHASSGRVAAVIVEPVQGNGGNIVPPTGYFAELRKVCDRNGMLMIVDEVQTGIGRTGCMYACETFGIEPDLIVLAKGLGGIGLPIGAILMRSELAVLEPHEHSFTSGANLLALAAAETTLDVIGATGFLAGVRRKSVLLGRGLRALAADSHGRISDVRGVGFMWGLEFVDAQGRPSAEVAARVVERALREHRLVLRTSRYGFGNVVKVRPALIASEAELIEICERLRLAMLGALND
jgi:4-aminobutyrate aminotransferase-like enzyme